MSRKLSARSSLENLTGLLVAAARGDAARAAAILDERPDLIDERGPLPAPRADADPAQDTGLRTALHFGVHHESVVRLLLERGANPNIRDDGDDAFPLHFAAERGELEIVRLLIDHGADPVGEGTMHELNVLGWAVCFDYAFHGDVADYLLAHGAKHTIHTAVAMGDVGAIRRIAARSPAVLSQPLDHTNRHRRPLHLAITKRQLGAVRALVELGVDLDATDDAGLTALDQAALAGEKGMAEVLLDRGSAVRLPAAVALNRVDDIARLVRDDPDCLAPGNRYGTLIIRAAERAPRQVIEILLRHGASVNAEDDEGISMDGAKRYTPLHAAAFYGNADAVRALLDHGASARIRDSKYCGTAAGWAAHAGHTQVRDMILARGIDLFTAVEFDRADRIESIVEQEPWLLNQRHSECATCDERDGQWWPRPWHTPLAWAVEHNQINPTRALLARGADLIRSPDGRTLFDLAIQAGHSEVAALIHEQAHGGSL